MKRNLKRRWTVIGLIFAALLTSSAAWWHFWIARPVGEGPAGPAVNAVVFKKTWTERPVLVVGVGDSVTAGFGASKGRSYFERVVLNPPDEFEDMQGLSLSVVIPNLSVTNLSVSGSTSPQHLRSQLPRLTRQPTNVLGIVLMTTGGNDIIHNYGMTPPQEGAMYGATFEQARPWITNFTAHLETMLTQIREAFPGGCHIFLANIYDPTDGLGDIQRAGLPAWPDGLRVLAEYNRILTAAADRHADVHLVDIHSAFLGHGIHCTQFWREHYDRSDPHYWFHVNLEDPNDRGYDVLRRLFLNKIADTLGQGTP